MNAIAPAQAAVNPVENPLDIYKKDVAEWYAYLWRVGARWDTAISVHAEGFKRHLETRGLKPRSIVRRMAGVSAVYDRAVRDGVLTRNPFDGVKRPRVGVSTAKGPTLEEAKRILEVCADDREKLLMRLMMFAGLRISEVLSITADNVRRVGDAAEIVIRAKGGHDEVVIVPGEIGIVEFAEGKAGRLFPFSRTRAWEIVKGIGLRAGVTYGCHAYRHSAATLYLDATGGDVRGCQRLLRHRNINTTMIYDDARRRLEKIDADIVRKYVEKN